MPVLLTTDSWLVWVDLLCFCRDWEATFHIRNQWRKSLYLPGLLEIPCLRLLQAAAIVAFIAVLFARFPPEGAVRYTGESDGGDDVAS